MAAATARIGGHLYLLIAERDIQAVKIDALTRPDSWKRNLCIRVILLILHEWDMDKVTGERLKKAFNDLNVSAEIRKEAVESLRAVRKAQQKAQKKLGDLRLEAGSMKALVTQLLAKARK